MEDNNVGMTWVKAPLLLVPFTTILGLITHFFVTDNLWIFVILILWGGIAPLIVYYRDNMRAPRMIDIQEDGFVAVYRNGKSEFIPWMNVYAISYYPGDPTKFGLGKIDKGAYLLKGKTLPCMLKGKLGKVMRDAYASKMGKYPPM